MKTRNSTLSVMALLACALCAPCAHAGQNSRQDVSFPALFTAASPAPVEQWAAQNFQLETVGIMEEAVNNGGPAYELDNKTFTLKISGGNIQIIAWVKAADLVPTHMDIGTSLNNNDKRAYFKNCLIDNKTSIFVITAQLRLAQNNSLLVLIRMLDKSGKTLLKEYRGIAAVKTQQTGKTLDLSYQFQDPADRNQGQIGSCHVFSSVSILEAAYYRKYHQKIKFSEADLFLRKVILSDDIYAPFVYSKQCTLQEGGNAHLDSQFVIKYGVATSLSYEKLEKLYIWYRNAEEKTMSSINSYADETDLSADAGKKKIDLREFWADLQTKPAMKEQLMKFFGAGDKVLKKERETIKKQLAGFKAVEWSNPDYAPEVVRYDKAKCAAEGIPVKRILLAELEEKRPVSVSVDMAGLEEWGQTDTSRDSKHAFTIIGYKLSPTGEYRFVSRNSWGGINPDLSESALCRVRATRGVYTPEEISAAK
jgi:hypothetical protein